MLHVQFDRWPLLVTVVSGRVTDEDVDALCKANMSAFRRGGRFISLVDLIALEVVPTALQRRTYAAWRKEHYEELRRHVIAVGFVVGDRPLLRGGLTALSWVAKHPSPEGYFKEHGEALAWLEDRLREDGGAPPMRSKSFRPGASASSWLKWR